MADENKVVPLGLLRSEAMAFAMLPYIALLTSHRVGAVVQILAVHATFGAVEVPFAVIVLVVFQIPLELLTLCLHLPFGLTFRVLCVCIF
jgi:hypothetical protein